MTKFLLALAALFAAPAIAAAPVVTVQNVTVAENVGSAPVLILKTKASSYSKITVQTVDGTAKAGIDYTPVNATLTLGNNTLSYRLPIPVIDNATYQGTRSFTLRITAVRNANVQTPTATVTINDDESPPPPTPVPTGNWVAAPLTVGGYAWTATNQPQGCCNGIVEKIIGGPVTSGDADPLKRQNMWLLQFYSDVTGNYPASDPYWNTLQIWWSEHDIRGLAPAATLRRMGQRGE